MFSFGFNFNFSYMPNPFCMTNVFTPCMPYVSPMYSIFNFNRLLSLFSFNNMFNNNQAQTNSEDYVSPSLYNALGLSLSSQNAYNNTNYYNSMNNILAYQTPQYQNTYINNPFEFLNNFSNGLVASLNKTPSYSSKPSTTNISTKTNLPQLKEVNYNESKGARLANEVLKNASNSSHGLCARYVRIAVENTGLGGYGSGHGYQWANILKNNPNFKEINVSGSELSSLPAGCIIVYDRGDQGYSSRYGHVEITLGDGRAVSDFVNKRIKPSDRAHVFVPV